MKSLRRVWAAAQRNPFAQHIKIGNQEAERYLILTRLFETDEAMRLAPSGIASRRFKESANCVCHNQRADGVIALSVL